MAESHLREGRRLRARPGGKASPRVETHRMNDVLFGHMGQVSYKPVEDEDALIGDLYSNRTSEQRELMHLILCSSSMVTHHHHSALFAADPAI